jgi:hypothetical protein
MSIEAIGIITFLAGGLCFVLGLTFAVQVFVVSTLFGASAALVVTSMSNANVQPAHLLLFFFAAFIALRPELLRRGTSCLQFPRAGFWLLLTVLYGIATALVMPRLFAGLTSVFTVRSDNGPMLAPLAPSSGNLTQTAYFVGDLICFVAIYSCASTRAGLRAVAYGLLICAGVNLSFAAADLVTYWTGTGDLLAFVRNASYRLLNDTEVSGFKRIVGSFSEAASFAYVTLGMLAFAGRLWLCGVFPRLTLSLATLSLAALIFSTSTTAYVGLATFFAVIYLESLLRTLTRTVTIQMFCFSCFLPVLLVTFVIILALNDAQWSYVTDLFNNMVLSKLSSNSGIERTAWNEQALRVFLDTDGFGAGIGSLRASSFPVAVLASIGVVGALTYGAFLFCILCGPGEDVGTIEDAFRLSARWACLALLIAASIAASFLDLGLVFFVFAALASARPKVNELPRTAVLRGRAAQATAVKAHFYADPLAY